MRHTFSFTCLRLFSFTGGILIPAWCFMRYLAFSSDIQPFICIGLLVIICSVSILLYATRFRHYSLKYIDSLSGEQFEQYVRHYFHHHGRKFYSSKFDSFLKHSINTVFFYCIFVKFYVFVYRILSYSVV